MSEKYEGLELCPKCGKGRLRNIGVDTVRGEAGADTFRHTATMRVQKCDHCGHRQVDKVLEEHTRGPASDNVTGTVIRIDPEDKTEE
jgi:ribosomal protein L32